MTEPDSAAQSSPLLSDGWEMGPNGLLTRNAARVIVLNEMNHALVVRGHDVDEPDRHWWFTIGGGIDAGESAHDAAIREVREETGLALAHSQLVGPILTRSAIFDFARQHCLQHEQFFLARVDRGTELSRAGWTDLERNLLDDIAWMSSAALRSSSDEVFPRGLADLVDDLARGWDGAVRHIGIETEHQVGIDTEHQVEG